MEIYFPLFILQEWNFLSLSILLMYNRHIREYSFFWYYPEHYEQL